MTPAEQATRIERLAAEFAALVRAGDALPILQTGITLRAAVDVACQDVRTAWLAEPFVELSEVVHG